jgi:hypothetical protein
MKLGAMARDLELGGIIADAAPLNALDQEYASVAAALKGLGNG